MTIGQAAAVLAFNNALAKVAAQSRAAQLTTGFDQALARTAKRNNDIARLVTQGSAKWPAS